MKKMFSLVELLVVLAVIGILVSILMPTLGKSRRQAFRAVCAGNQKQMGYAVDMHTKDNDGYLPYAQRDGDLQPHVFWKRQLNAYLGGPTDKPLWSEWEDSIAQGAFVCPINDTGYTNHAAGGYAWNYVYLGTNTGFTGGGTTHRLPQKLLFMQSAAETTNIGDTSDYFKGTGQYWKAIRYSPPSVDSNEVGDRHFNGINRLWLDGHVSADRKAVVLAGKNGKSDYYHQKTKGESHW